MNDNNLFIHTVCQCESTTVLYYNNEKETATNAN